MGKIKGTVPTAVTLDKQSCYRLRTGRCSLDIVEGFDLSSPIRVGTADLLYCPRLYRAMKERERERCLSVTPCVCGHAEAAAAPQKACIAARRHMELFVQPSGREPQTLCTVCGRQMTFEEELPDREGPRLLELRVVAEAPPEEEQEHTQRATTDRRAKQS